MRAILQIDASLIKALDTVVLDINYIDVVTIELLEISILQTWPLDAPVVWHLMRNKDIFRAFVGNACTLFLDPEIVDRLIRLLVEQVVLVVT